MNRGAPGDPHGRFIFIFENKNSSWSCREQAGARRTAEPQNRRTAEPDQWEMEMEMTMEMEMEFGRAGDKAVTTLKNATETFTEVLRIGWKHQAELVELRAAAEKLNQECLAATAENEKLKNTEAFLKHALEKAREERAAATAAAEAATAEAKARTDEANKAIWELAALKKCSKKDVETIKRLTRRDEARQEEVAQLKKEIAQLKNGLALATDDAKTLRGMVGDAAKNDSADASTQLVDAVRAALNALAKQKGYKRTCAVLACVLDDTGGNPRSSKKKDGPVRVVLLVHDTPGGFMCVAMKESRNGTSRSATDRGSWRLYDPNKHLPADDDMDGGWSKKTFVTRNKALDFLKAKKRAWMNAQASYRFGILIGGQAGEEQRWKNVHMMVKKKALCDSLEEMNGWLDTAYDEFLPPAGAAGAAAEPEPEPEPETAVATFSEPEPDDPVVDVVEDDRAATPIRLPGGLKRPRSPEAESGPESESDSAMNVQEDGPPLEKRPRTTVGTDEADTVVIDGFPFTSAGSNKALNEALNEVPVRSEPEHDPEHDPVALPRVRVREVAGPHRDGPGARPA